MGSGWIGMSGESIGGGCEIWRVVAEDLRRAPLGSLPAEGPGSEGVRGMPDLQPCVLRTVARPVSDWTVTFA
jgi:hypothetical protein